MTAGHICGIEATCRSKIKLKKTESDCNCRNKTTLFIDCTYRRRCNVCDGYHFADYETESYAEEWFIEKWKRPTGIYKIKFKDNWITARYGIDETFSAYCLPITAYWWIPGESKILVESYIQEVGDRV